jgi:hypothetical protein
MFPYRSKTFHEHRSALRASLVDGRSRSSTGAEVCLLRILDESTTAAKRAALAAGSAAER